MWSIKNIAPKHIKLTTIAGADWSKRPKRFARSAAGRGRSLRSAKTIPNPATAGIANSTLPTIIGKKYNEKEPASAGPISYVVMIILIHTPTWEVTRL